MVWDRVLKSQDLNVESLEEDDPSLLAFIVRSGSGEYLVTVLDNMMRCECPDYYYRHGEEGSYLCKHCWAVLRYLLSDSTHEGGGE